MKKLVLTLTLVIGLASISFAQKGKNNGFEKMSVEQKTTLAVKKMTLKLDLTTTQAKQIKSLLLEQVKNRKTMKEKRKALKESGKKPTVNQRFTMANKKLDKQIAFKAEMKRILNEKQYEMFEKIASRKYKKRKNRYKI